MYLPRVWLSQSLSVLSPWPRRHLYYPSFIEAAWECPFGLQNVTTMQENCVMSEKDVYIADPAMRHFTLLNAIFLKGKAYKKKLHAVNYCGERGINWSWELCDKFEDKSESCLPHFDCQRKIRPDKDNFWKKLSLLCVIVRTWTVKLTPFRVFHIPTFRDSFTFRLVAEQKKALGFGLHVRVYLFYLFTYTIH